MPKVYLNEADRINDRIASWIYGSMKINHISQAELAEELGVSQQVLSYRLKNRVISVSDFVCLIKTFNAENEEVLRLLK